MTMPRRTLLATALVLAPTVAMAQTTPPLTAEQMAYYGKPFQDARFVGFARTANDFEVRSGNLALTKSTNEMTRGVATRAVQVFTVAVHIQSLLMRRAALGVEPSFVVVLLINK